MRGGELCNEGTDSCDIEAECTADDQCPDDGEFCNGTESCDVENGVCVSSGDPCTEDQTCNETTNTCEGGEDLPPLINEMEDATTLEGQPFTSAAPTLRQGSEPITWELEIGPAGMVIDAATGVVSWANPTTAGSPHTVTIRATNDLGFHITTYLVAVGPLSDGSGWWVLDVGVNGRVRAMEVYDDGTGEALYAAGDFTEAGGVSASRIAKWDGTSWSALGAGLTGGSVYTLVVFDDGGGEALYAGGDFTTAGGAAATRIARWDGATWTTLGEGMNGEVRSLAVFNDGSGNALYAAGDFTQAGGVAGQLASLSGVTACGAPLGVGLAGGDAYAMTVWSGAGVVRRRVVHPRPAELPPINWPSGTVMPGPR